VLLKLLPKSEVPLLLFIFIGSLIALSGAYLAEFIGFEPCILCLYQRIPYWCAIFLCLMGILARANNKKLFGFILLAIGLALLCEIGIAFYHVLVEHHIIRETTECASSINLSDNPKIALEQLSATPAISCAHPEIIILGVSMAEWNLLYSLFLTLIFLHNRLTNVTRR